ncbi:unnamed protein product [Closterium sp. Yama58-4]|nr:unnamed protein product [Closterium sp. Yama58-4]
MSHPADVPNLPKGQRSRPVSDLPLSTDAVSSTVDKSPAVSDNGKKFPSEAGGSGLSAEDKATIPSVGITDDGGFIDDDSDDDMVIDLVKEADFGLRSVAILLIPFMLSKEISCIIDAVKALITHGCTRIDRALVSQSLLPHLSVASHVKPDEPVADHSCAVVVAFKLDVKACTGPGLWRLHASMVNRPGVRKIIEATVRRTPVNDGSSFELLVARLSAGLRAYAKEESKRVRATVTHLTSTVAALTQEMMRNPLCSRTKELLRAKEVQLKMYQSARKERLHMQAGSTAELTGEIASKHLSAQVKARKARTQISELKDGSASITGSKEILAAASGFFKNIFRKDRRTDRDGWSFNPSRRLDGWVAETLTREWSEQEVKNAFAAMARNKSPGSDGLPKELFEAHWDLLGESFMAMAKDFEGTAALPAEIKEAVTILLHKKGDKEQLNNYRPITLLNFAYKVLARVVADRMKSVLHMVISPEQYGFIPGRRLSDAVALVADIIEGAKNDKGDCYMLLVDFQKAFDSVSRDFLFQVLESMGFPEQFVGWIEGLHEGTTTKLLINGWLGEGVDVVSGVRQGCPLAPYLFLCAVEPLALEVERKELGLEKDGHRLGYLGYADDTTLVLQGEAQIGQAEEILDRFEMVSGLTTNKNKSVVLPLGANIGATGGGSFKWAGADEAERLLGIWVTPSGSGRPTWEKAWSCISEKLTKWQLKYLTITARATVVNFYITPILAFQAQIFPPPADIWLEIMRLIHSFTSGNRVATAKGFTLWSRELLFTPRLDGGIGVRDPEILITCLAARRVGLFITEKNPLKRDLMERAAKLPLGLDSFTAHKKLLKHWENGSAQWKQTVESFMRSPFSVKNLVGSREEVLRERLAFNADILLNGTTNPLGGQKDAQGLTKLRVGDLLEGEENGAVLVKSMEVLKQELGGNGPAKLAMRALLALPSHWHRFLGFPTVPPQSAGLSSRVPILEGERDTGGDLGSPTCPAHAKSQPTISFAGRSTVSENGYQVSFSGADPHVSGAASSLGGKMRSSFSGAEVSATAGPLEGGVSF